MTCFTKHATTTVRFAWYKKLIEFDKKFQDDLVSLSWYTQQFDKALFLIEEMERTVGISSTLELYKMQISAIPNRKNHRKNIWKKPSVKIRKTSRITSN